MATTSIQRNVTVRNSLWKSPTYPMYPREAAEKIEKRQIARSPVTIE
jgi:hypothetical protein